MKLLLTICIIATLSPALLGDSPVRGYRNPKFIKETEELFEHSLEIVKETEGFVKGLFKVLPKTDDYENAKENLRSYLSFLFKLNSSPKNCLAKLVTIFDEYNSLIEIDEEQNPLFKNETENKEKETSNEEKETSNEEKKESGSKESSEEKSEVKKNSSEEKKEESVEGGEVGENAEGGENGEDVENTENNENAENTEDGEEQEEEEEEQREEDPASFQARVQVAKLLKEVSGPEFNAEFKKIHETFEKLDRKKMDELRSADFDYSMEIFQLITKMC